MVVVDVLTILFETIAIATISNCIVSGDNIPKSTILTCLYIIVSTAYIELFNIFQWDTVWTILVHVFCFCYCFSLCRKVNRALFATTAAIIVIIVLEMILSIPSVLIKKYMVLDNNLYSLVISFLMALIVYYVVHHRKLQKELCSFYQIFEKKTYFIILILGFLLLLSYAIKYRGSFDCLDFIIFLAYFVTILGISYLWRQESIKNLKQKYETEQLGIYNQAYDTILKDMHARQHEFKNHLNNIVNMHVLYKDYESLVQNQMSYVGELKESYKYSKLLDTKQPILSGYLYMLFSKYEDINAEIDYNIEVADVTAFMSIIDLIEVLGVLIDNAFQAVKLLENRKIKIYIEENEDSFSIKVNNTLEKEIRYKELSQFFDEGYSTKGDGHGVGLFNVKNIVRRYQGDIIIHSYTENNISWIVIGCILKRR